MAEFNRIAVIGLGYIGLPTATAFALNGKRVFGVDIDDAVISSVNSGETHIVEPELDIAVKKAVSSQRLSADKQVQAADAFLITVPTPLTADFKPDLSYVKAAVQSIAPFLHKGNLVILESTSPVGTTEQVAQWLKSMRPDLHFPHETKEADINIAYCPERVLPGNIMYELFNSDRIIGGMSPKCAQRAVALYNIFVKGQCLTTNVRTAEMCKLTENAFRDVNIAFANELSVICDRLDINVWEVIRLANRHPRVDILWPGPGVGGHCIAVDPWFIVSQAEKQARLIRTARNVNDDKPQWVLDKLKTVLADYLTDTNKTAAEVKIACLGLTFKADVSDLRESPALKIVEQLANWHKGTLLTVEPNIRRLPASLMYKTDLVELDYALQHADILLLLVDHKQFKAYSANHLTQRIVDTRGIWTS